MIIIVLFSFVVLLLITYEIFNKDILQPAVILVATYLISIASAVINIKKWNIHLSVLTAVILLIGAIEFVVINLLIYSKTRKKDEKKEIKIQQNSKIAIWKIVCLSLVSYIILDLVFINVLDIAGRYGTYSTISQALTLFKQHTSYSNDASMPRYIAWLQKITYPAAYIMMYYFIKSVVFTKEDRIKVAFRNVWYLVSPICFAIQEFLTSNRLSIIALLIGALTMTIILIYEKNEWKNHIKIKYIGIIGVIGIVFLIVFYFSAQLIGRQNKKNIVDYITLYCGGSIECLNQYLEEPMEKTDYIVGQESVYYFIKNLRDYKIIKVDQLPTVHLEFRYYKDIMIGNVYTAYRRWINDFGYIGVFVLQALMAGFYAFVYNKIKCIKKYKDFVIIMYAYLSYPIFLHCIDGYFYLLTVRVAFITTFMIFVLVYLFLTHNSIREKEGM